MIADACEASEASPESQVDVFLERFSGDGASRFWEPLPSEDSAEACEPEVQSSAHVCDLALRRIVSQALANVPTLEHVVVRCIPLVMHRGRGGRGGKVREYRMLPQEG